MRRIAVLLAVLSLAVAAGVSAAPASAKTPCRDRIYADWYADGKIASTYPLACYRDALKHAEGRADVGVYSSMLDDIRLALQAAVKRSQGQDVPAEVGGSAPVSANGSASSTPGSTTTNPTASTNPHMPADTVPSSPDPGAMTTANPTAAQPASSGGGVPVPLLVLGGVAIALVASGAIGLGVKRFRGREG